MILGRLALAVPSRVVETFVMRCAPAVIAVAVLASTSTARARLEALVAARPGLRLADLRPQRPTRPATR